MTHPEPTQQLLAGQPSAPQVPAQYYGPGTYPAAPVPMPPPMPPREPQYVQTNHVLHLILSLLTFGMWAMLVWPWLTILHMCSNNQKRRQFDESMSRYNHDFWMWQQGQQGRR